ncbi:MAG: hypothetical protein IJ812_08465 [Schwartzia sp.]|nr:hypothetical protein [Schwartzia sp. (in: firmicutes)]
MRSPMDEQTFLGFYKTTVLGYSKSVQRYYCNLLERSGKITFDMQLPLLSTDTKLFTDKKDLETVISATAMDEHFSGFYEKREFEKLYKYSIPFFIDGNDIDKVVSSLNQVCGGEFCEDNFKPKLILNTSLRESVPTYVKDNDKIFIKFVLQKSYVTPDVYESINYRFPIVIYIDFDCQVLEIRYDSTKYNEISGRDTYDKYVSECLEWIKKTLPLELYDCDGRDAVNVVKKIPNKTVVVFRQMMEMESGGSAELTASEGEDYVLPFIGEIHGLIEENEELFNASHDIKALLLQYLSDKEESARYPYIYVKWVKPVESHSYIVKITFNYFSDRYTVLQHITGSCNDFGMERMNHAIEYLCKNNALVKGKKI